MNASIHLTAHKYIQLGWSLTPLQGKRPIKKNWLNNSVCTPSEVERWFTKNTSNIGVLTGKESKIVVLDIDPRNGGDETLQEWIKELGDLPKTVQANTGGGGSHYVFKYFDGASSRSIDGMDFLSDGKQFVVFPSVHPSTDKQYEWVISPFEMEPAELPQKWQEKLTRNQCEPKISFTKMQNNICEGERNKTLTAIAGSLFAKGYSSSKVEITLLEENQLRCNPPLEISEVQAIVSSVGNYESTASHKTKWQRAVCDAHDLQSTTKLVLFVLSMYADADGRSCYPTQETIGKSAKLKRKAISDHSKIAEAKGWIKRYPRKRSGKNGIHYGYILTISGLTHYEFQN